jgi:hypothetical protein
LFRYKTHVDFGITMVDSTLLLYQYVDDPKKGHVLALRKGR